ncbi:MAG: hypothetical protein ACI8WB_006162 [Phenylobacterium sp.]|jgi:hypothetical protein
MGLQGIQGEQGPVGPIGGGNLGQYLSRSSTGTYTEQTAGFIVGWASCGSTDNRDFRVDVLVNNVKVIRAGNYSQEYGVTNTYHSFTVSIGTDSSWRIEVSRCTVQDLHFVSFSSVN